ncbi:hypothetical protein T459_14737 [Capsicum annuum]|uniref:Uncharacterized protein n=1 Tax=Capsicum annuum TaxID=4072 RepID=A0A2G2ZIA7_CAPAN|nr:hypothetical protein FXO37_17916 [Capsicum annuum]PHT81722.1 hypothetical protein T459_14737 [Capsicum annuum]
MVSPFQVVIATMLKADICLPRLSPVTTRKLEANSCLNLENKKGHGKNQIWPESEKQKQSSESGKSNWCVGWLVVVKLTGLRSRQWSKSRGGVGLITVPPKIELTEMVRLKDYTFSSSKGKYLLIEANDGTVLTRLLTETPIPDRVAAMMVDKQTSSLAVPVLSSIYNGLNRVYKSSQLEQLRVSFPIHYVYGWLVYYFKTSFPLSNGPSIPLMTVHFGEDSMSKTTFPKAKSNMRRYSSIAYKSWWDKVHGNFLEVNLQSLVNVVGPIIDTPLEHGEEVLIVVKPPVLKFKNLLWFFFELLISYDQAQSTLVDKDINIKESGPHLKAKENLELVLKERDEKSKEVSATCKSPEKVRKKVKKLKARRDSVKQEAA